MSAFQFVRFTRKMVEWILRKGMIVKMAKMRIRAGLYYMKQGDESGNFLAGYAVCIHGLVGFLAFQRFSEHPISMFEDLEFR
jgi:hypothetical protein